MASSVMRIDEIATAAGNVLVQLKNSKGAFRRPFRFPAFP